MPAKSSSAAIALPRSWTSRVASWLKRVDEQGPDALVQLPVPVNRYPDFVRHAVQQLKSLCPMLGKMKRTQILARAGLHLGVATIGRMLKEQRQPKPPTRDGDTAGQKRVVTAKYPGHLWHTDLTVVPTARGSGRLGSRLLCRNAGPLPGGLLGRGSFFPPGDGLRRVSQGAILGRNV